MNSKPLISFVLLAYKQEKFIREAVEGALAQTYSPLEIILSDDCSPDWTFKIMEEMVKAYKGPHRVILNRNERNLGLGAHFSRVMDMARGELILTAAGDDISLPNRTTDLVDEWIKEGCPSGICSNVSSINESGEALNVRSSIIDNSKKMLNSYNEKKHGLLFTETVYPCLIGCSAAWSKKCWQIFGNLNQQVVYEDLVMTFRASMLNGIFISDKILVKYRQHETNATNQQINFHKQLWSPREYRLMEKEKTTHANRYYRALENMLKDMNELDSSILELDIVSKIKIANSLKKSISLYRVKAHWWDMTLMNQILNLNSVSNDSLFVTILKLFPLKSYALVRSALAHVKRKVTYAYLTV
jgi:glycosyltransferase involved in cell wall biosynthesis